MIESAAILHSKIQARFSRRAPKEFILQIIALGGGGFSDNPGNLMLDIYILQQAKKPKPRVLFLPTAGGDSDEYALIAVLSPEAHFIERVRMLDKDHLEDRMTIIDPKNFTAPWHISRQYSRVTRIHRMVHEDCEGEERNPVVNGRFTLTPPPQSESAGKK